MARLNSSRNPIGSFFRHQSIRRKLRWIVGLTSALAVLMISTVMVIYDRHLYEEQIASELAITAGIVGNTCAATLLFDDQDTARDILHALAADDRIEEACLYSLRREVFASYQRAGDLEAIPVLPDKPLTRIEDDGIGIPRKDVDNITSPLAWIQQRLDYKLMILFCNQFSSVTVVYCIVL